MKTYIFLIFIIFSVCNSTTNAREKIPLTVDNITQLRGQSGLELNDKLIYFSGKSTTSLIRGPRSRERFYTVDLNCVYTTKNGTEFMIVIRSKKRNTVHFIKINKANEHLFKRVYLIF